MPTKALKNDSFKLMLRHLISIAQRATTFLWTVLRTYKKTVTFMLILLITIYWYINVYSAFENMMERLALRLPNDAELAELMKRASNRSCPPLYGKVTVLVAANTEAIRRSYHVAQDSLQCYLKSTDYVFRFVDLDRDKRVAEHCSQFRELLFRKHCAASVYLSDTDWLLVLDADTGVVNPSHCIEQWINPDVDLIFYERFFNWEIASGNYLAKNTSFARDFLLKWAQWEFHKPAVWSGHDNGALQIHILQTVMPEFEHEIEMCTRLWHLARDYFTYYPYVVCVKTALGARRFWKRQLMIYRRGHGWVRDGHLANERWSHRDFMLHHWKLNIVSKDGFGSLMPFSRPFNLDECGAAENPTSGFHWRPNMYVSEGNMKQLLFASEQFYMKDLPKPGHDLPWLRVSDVGHCWPHCQNVSFES